MTSRKSCTNGHARPTNGSRITHYTALGFVGSELNRTGCVASGSNRFSWNGVSQAIHPSTRNSRRL